MFILAVFILQVVFCHMEIKNVEAGQVFVENFPISNDDGGGGAGSDLHKSLSFFPSNLDFGEWAVGTAKSHIVTLVNKNSNRSVFLSSISGKTSTFYSSFFDEKVIPPQGNTTFNVVFLPRNHGNVETNLLIHTSFGQAILPVKGHGLECPYKLRPLVGIKAPFNSTLHMYLYMYNPHTNPIQILEVYSSGGQFQLELPSGTQEGPQALWEIPPLTTKPIIRIRFHGTSPGNHTAYIRIKISNNNNTNNNQKDENILMVPIECEILPNYGIYSTNPILDFGRLTTTDLIKTIKLNLTNSGKELYEIYDYKLKNLHNFIKFDKHNLSVTINPKLAKNNIHLNGELIIQSQLQNNINNLMELSISIEAEIFNGSLEYDKNLTVFITGTQKNHTKDNERDFNIENKFTIPIAITNLSYDNSKNHTKIMKINNFQSQIILPNEIKTIFQIKILNDTHIYTTNIRLETNLTNYNIPIVIATGHLNRFTSIDSINLTNLPNDKILDFGTIPFGDFSTYGYILFKNPNPFPIQLLNWTFTNPKGVYYNSMFLGCLKPNINLNSSPPIKSDGTPLTVPERFEYCVNISANSIAGYELAVQSFHIKTLLGTFRVWTDYEEIVTSVKFVTVIGRLEIDQSKLHFSDCFPGKRCSADISIHSTFLKTMRVNAITVSVPGLVFEYQTQNNLPEIAANSITDVGRIYFDPKSVCQNNCYIPQESDIEARSCNDNILSFDESELRRRTEMYRRFKWNLQTITFTLNTSEVRLFEFNSTVDIIWPKLVRDIQTLPTTEIGQTYNGKITIYNPSDRPLLLDLNLSDPKKAKATSLSLPLEVVEICVFCYLTDEDVFHLSDRKNYLIKPNSFINVDIQFTSRESGVYSTLLHIRNNLTLYEAVWVTAKAVQPQFRFGNRKPGSTAPLLFEITEKHLTSCDKQRDFFNGQQVVVSTKRTFTAKNTGEVPIRVETFKIGEQNCEGYGFKILNCEKFDLKANSSKKIDVAFTPDFTMARISRILVLKTNLSYSVNYTLLATIPPGCLEQCSKSLQRPYWELSMQKMSIGMLSVAFVFVLIAAFFESDKILKEHVQNMSKDKGPVQPPLDLRNIASLDKDEPISYISNTEHQDRYANSGGSGVKMNTFGGLKKRTMKKNIQNGSTTASGITTFKEKSWAEELVKKFTPNLQSISKEDQSVTPILTNNGTFSKNHNDKSYILTSTPKNRDEKLTPPKKSKENNEKLLNFEKIEKEPKKYNIETEKKIEINSIESKKTKLSLKKSKSAPLSSVANNSGSQDTSSNTSGSPVNPKTEEQISKKQKEKFDLQTIRDKKSIELSPLQFPTITNNNIELVDNTINNNCSNNLNKSTTKKYGKTPGRERKKEADKLKQRLERKLPKYKGNSIQFGSSLNNNIENTTDYGISTISNNNNNIWDPNQASFSHVVAQNITHNSFVQTSPGFDKLIDLNTTIQTTDWNEADLKNNETFGCDIPTTTTTTSAVAATTTATTATEEPQKNSIDLGPIGTRKSPSSTPIWEPLPTNIHRPTPNNNSSFFSNNFLLGNNFDFDNQNEYLGGSSGLLDHLLVGQQQQQQQQSQNQWQTNDLLLTLLQQQQLKQQQINSNIPEWQIDNRTWTPMGYKTENDNGWQQQQQQQQIRGAVRPPPGLPNPNHEPSMNQNQLQQQQLLLLQQLQYQQSQQNMMMHSNLQQQQQSEMENPTIAGGTQNFTNSTSNEQQQINQIQPFDPFSSLSAIWSDTWKNHHQQQ